MCYLNLLLTNHEPPSVYVWLQEGLPVQHGIIYPLSASHLHVQECAVGYRDVSPYWLCLRHLTDPAIHTHLPLSPREGGRLLHWIFWLNSHTLNVMGETNHFSAYKEGSRHIHPKLSNCWFKCLLRMVWKCKNLWVILQTKTLLIKGCLWKTMRYFEANRYGCLPALIDFNSAPNWHAVMFDAYTVNKK